MDVGLLFIMVNYGKVKENDIVFDLFVGIGGFLIVFVYFGVYVYGIDIDYNIVYGLGKVIRKNQKWRGLDENIRVNFCQYGLEKYYFDVLVLDVFKFLEEGYIF